MVIRAGPKLIIKLKCDYEGWTVTTVLLLYDQELETITGQFLLQVISFYFCFLLSWNTWTSSGKNGISGVNRMLT